MRALLLLLFAPLLHAQLPDAPAPVHARDQYVGDAACAACHREKYESYQDEAHHMASRLPSASSIHGKFAPGSNVLRTTNPSLYFQMTTQGEGFLQTAYANLPPSPTIAHQERFDFVIGSGRKGQTYLYWKDDQLYELPVSYWTATDRWMNSPGYPDGLPNFDKPIIPRCVECHATYFESLPPPLNRFNKTNEVLGITCERCHGPGRAHVTRTQANLPFQQDIVNPSKLPRERQMDLCALCHAAPGTPRGPSFSFVAGDTLAKYLTIPVDAPDTPTDVHGHQVQQLSNSRCYRSTNMTCATCHNVHAQQRDVASFSKNCLSCHKADRCGKYATLGTQILTKCVDCHMPLTQSNQIVFDADGGQIKPQVRNHRIAIYSDAALPLHN
jgi:hypothetical protein